MIILDDIPFEVDFSNLIKKMRIKEGSRQIERVTRFAEEAQSLARPKALYRVLPIESREGEQVVIDGVAFKSRLLRDKLEEAHRVFPYVATGGMELEEWTRGIEDMLQRFWADTIAEMALREAVRVLNRHINETHHPGRSATMNPGSLPDWPIWEQRALFKLLGDPQKSIGVQLTDSMLMVPTKSVSGIRFPTETRFENCQMCQMPNCPGRRAPYDPAQREKYSVPAPVP